MNKTKKWFLICAAVWALIATSFFFGCVAWAEPALKMQVPPFDATIYKLHNQETGDPLTWHECLDVEEHYRIRIAEEDPSLGEALLDGSFVVECIEIDIDGEEVIDES